VSEKIAIFRLTYQVSPLLAATRRAGPNCPWHFARALHAWRLHDQLL